jgi:type I restriction-modification system DNA methylase subunit/restriction endonuclease S subunit
MKKSSKKVEKNETDYSYLRLPDNQILIELEKKDNKVKSEDKKNILKMIDKAHNYLYNSENIEGEDALNDIMNFLFIKSIQPIISNKEEDGKIDLLNKKYYKHLYDDKELTEILSYFQNLSNLSIKELDVIRNLNESNDAIRQMGDILKNHPLTKQIFTENNFIKARKAPTIQGLLNDVIIPLNITEIEQNEDVIGEIYEHIINGYVKKGSKLGQFFTPRKLMKLIFNYKEDKINQIIKKLDKKEKIKFYDSCMGTGGWLVTGYNLFKDKYGDRILLSGGEVKSTTFQYGLMNLILTLKKFPDDVSCESSLTHINNNKHHFVLTNPPFQTDKKFEQIKENFKTDKFTEGNKIKLDDIYNLKDNSPPIQFLELNKYKLEENGLCLIILPYGELFFGSSNKDARKHFMKETNITDIILFEGGTFTHTGIKTCGLIFEKDKKGTNAINFIQANKECNTLTKITTVSIDDIEKETNSSWYLCNYLKDEYIESLSSKMTNFQWVEFGDIFTLEKGKIQSSKVEEVEDGEYTILSISEKNKLTNIIEVDNLINGENLFIATTSSGTSCGPYETKIKYYNGKCSYTNLLCRLVINDKYKNKVSIKYIYYYLNSIKEHIETVYEKGACNKSLDQKNFNRMKIPIIPIEEQSKIINKYDNIKKEKNILKELINCNIDKIKFYFEYAIKNNIDDKYIKKISDVCIFKNGTQLDSKDIEDGIYPVYGGGVKQVGMHNEFNRNGCETIVCGTGSCGFVNRCKTKFWASQCFTIESKDSNILLNEYLYYYSKLCLENIFMNSSKGANQPFIRYTQFLMIPIPVLPINIQTNILNNIYKFEDLNNLYTKNINELSIITIDEFIKNLDVLSNGFNIDKLIDLDTNEEIKEVPKKKTKSKSTI